MSELVKWNIEEWVDEASNNSLDKTSRWVHRLPSTKVMRTKLCLSSVRSKLATNLSHQSFWLYQAWLVPDPEIEMLQQHMWRTTRSQSYESPKRGMLFSRARFQSQSTALAPIAAKCISSSRKSHSTSPLQEAHLHTQWLPNIVSTINLVETIAVQQGSWLGIAWSPRDLFSTTGFFEEDFCCCCRRRAQVHMHFLPR